MITGKMGNIGPIEWEICGFWDLGLVILVPILKVNFTFDFYYFGSSTKRLLCSSIVVCQKTCIHIIIGFINNSLKPNMFVLL